ncbi:hypothetical protein ABK040_014878 [Willaertia magna]
MSTATFHENSFLSSITTGFFEKLLPTNLLTQNDPWSDVIEEDEPHVQPFAWSLFSFFTTYYTITFIFFLFRKDKQPLKSRSPIFVFILFLDHFFCYSVLSLRLAIGRKAFPCIIYLAFQFFGFPVIAVPYLVQCIRLYYISEVNRLQGDSFQSHINSLGINIFHNEKNNGDNPTTPSDRNSLPKRDSFVGKVKQNSVTTLKNVFRKSSTVDNNKNNESKTAKEEKDWSQKRRRLLQTIRKLGQDEFLLKLFLLSVALNGLIFLAFSGNFLNRVVGEYTWNGGCAATVSVYIVAFSLIAFYGLFLILFFYKVMRHAKESYGIKIELIIVVSMWLFFFISFIILSNVPGYPEYTFSAVWCLCFGLFITSIVSLWVPIIRSFYWNKNSGNYFKKLTKSTVDDNNTNQFEMNEYVANMNDSHVIDVTNNNNNDKLAKELLNEEFKKTLFIEAKLIPLENNSTELKEEQANKILDPRIIIFVLFHEEVCQRYLKEFCEKEFSVENFLFLYFINKVYKELKVDTMENIERKVLIAKNLFNNFIKAHSAFELNLPSQTRTTIIKTLNNLEEVMKSSILTTTDECNAIALEEKKSVSSPTLKECVSVENTSSVVTDSGSEVIIKQDIVKKVNNNSKWKEEHGIELNNLFDIVEDGVLQSVQDTWSRFIENDSFISMCKELQEYEVEMKKLNLV